MENGINGYLEEGRNARNKDVKPDNFDSGYPIIIEGRFQEDGKFLADKLLVKCPSKYEEETEAGGET